MRASTSLADTLDEAVAAGCAERQRYIRHLLGQQRREESRYHLLDRAQILGRQSLDGLGNAREKPGEKIAQPGAPMHVDQVGRVRSLRSDAIRWHAGPRSCRKSLVKRLVKAAAAGAKRNIISREQLPIGGNTFPVEVKADEQRILSDDIDPLRACRYARKQKVMR